MNDSIKNALNDAARASLSRLVSMELATCELMAAEFAKISDSAQDRVILSETSALARAYRQASSHALQERATYLARCEVLRMRLLDLK